MASRLNVSLARLSAYGFKVSSNLSVDERYGGRAHAVTQSTPRMIGVYLFVNDIDATTSFYSMLGLVIEPVSDLFARASWNDAVVLEFGTKELTTSYDPGFEQPGRLSKSTINFELESVQAVDSKFEQLTAAGHIGHLNPVDAPWHARFAIVEDPDGNFVGLHSPRDREQERIRERPDA